MQNTTEKEIEKMYEEYEKSGGVVYLKGLLPDESLSVFNKKIKFNFNDPEGLIKLINRLKDYRMLEDRIKEHYFEIIRQTDKAVLVKGRVRCYKDDPCEESKEKREDIWFPKSKICFSKTMRNTTDRTYFEPTSWAECLEGTYGNFFIDAIFYDKKIIEYANQFGEGSDTYSHILGWERFV